LRTFLLNASGAPAHVMLLIAFVMIDCRLDAMRIPPDLSGGARKKVSTGSPGFNEHKSRADGHSGVF
jgi:hypothetical protein